VLVLGGSSGVGSAAVQIAKALGATVTTTCSAANAAFARSIGADRVADKADWPESLATGLRAIGSRRYYQAVATGNVRHDHSYGPFEGPFPFSETKAPSGASLQVFVCTSNSRMVYVSWSGSNSLNRLRLISLTWLSQAGRYLEWGPFDTVFDCIGGRPSHSGQPTHADSRIDATRQAPPVSTMRSRAPNR
jgi:hypothetical protein